MLPGQKYTPEEVLVVLRRRFWFLAVPFALIAAAGAWRIHGLPNRYQASAQILIVSQQVPERLVGRTVTRNLDDRIASMKAQVLSRANLEPLINQFDLYAGQRRSGLMQDAVERMRTVDIDLQLTRDVLTVSYSGSNPAQVKQVADALATMFINQSIQDRRALAQGTTEYFDAQIQETLKKIETKEAELSAFQIRNAGQLPAQETATMNGLQAVRAETRQLTDQIGQAASQRAQWDSELTFLESQPPVSAPVTATPTPGQTPRGATTLDRLTAARQLLADLQRQGHGPEWPAVKAAQRQVTDLEKEVDRESYERPVSADPTPVSAAEQARQKRIADLRASVASLDLNVTKWQDQIKANEATERELVQRLAAMPLRQSEWQSISRDYDSLQGTYRSLLSKRAESLLAANLDRREMGETFQLVDPARRPQTPTSPNRPVLTLLALLAGLAVGGGVVALLEYRDRSFRSDTEVTRLLDLPVLAVVPFMQSQADKRRRLMTRLAVSAGLGSVVLAGLAVVAYTLVR